MKVIAIYIRLCMNTIILQSSPHLELFLMYVMSAIRM